ncbi:hypothetical protein [Falsiroseomonas sp. HW251]|uniref:hypothetical protein n=1 Tax=Falsiroseomonas sp. HW251 TaxID=3390998 RepID=UPI003D3223BA
MRASLRPLLLALPLLGLGAEAMAQPAIRPQQQQQAPQMTPAPALPGLATRAPQQPIPAEPGAQNLSPNAALFDAINRGDLAAARDAVGRGASLESRNAIGLSPIDAAVDQGRHEIAFYLLSARDPAPSGSPGGAPPPAPNRAGLDAPPANLSNPGGGAAVLAAASQRRNQPAQAAPRAARLWGNDGGSPIPQIGFLGFDAGRPEGGRRGGRS